MRILVVTADPSFAIGAARMHPEARVLVASPNQLPSRTAEPFEVAVVDAGSDARNREVARTLEDDGTAHRSVLIGDAAAAAGDRPSLSRPFTLDDLVDVLGLTVDGGDRDDRGGGFLGRMLRRWMPDGAGAEGAGEPDGAARVRAWPRMDLDDDRDDEGFSDAIAAAERAAELLDALPPVRPASEEAVALAVTAGERLEGKRAVVWLEDGDGFRAHIAGGGSLPRVAAGQPVLSALSEDVSAVLLRPPGPGADLVGSDVQAVVAARLRHAGRFLGAVAVGGRGFGLDDRDDLLEVARQHAARLALARTVDRLRQ